MEERAKHRIIDRQTLHSRAHGLYGTCSIHSKNHWENVGDLAHERSVRKFPVEGVHSGRTQVDEDFPLTRGRLGQVHQSRRVTNLVDCDRAHRSAPNLRLPLRVGAGPVIRPR